MDESVAAVSKADDAVKKFIESDDEEVHDMEGSELILKLIEKKIAKLTKKCYKLGGCGKWMAHIQVLECETIYLF